MRIIEMASGSAQVRIAPAVGGAIAAFTVRDTPMLRPTPAAALVARDVRRTACYPLVPYSNRIATRGLRFGGHDYALARNFGDHPHAIHGVGWQRPWTVDDASSATSALLALEHDAAARRRARVAVALSRDAVVRARRRQRHAAPRCCASR